VIMAVLCLAEALALWWAGKGGVQLSSPSRDPYKITVSWDGTDKRENKTIVLINVCLP